MKTNSKIAIKQQPSILTKQTNKLVNPNLFFLIFYDLFFEQNSKFEALKQQIQLKKQEKSNTQSNFNKTQPTIAHFLKPNEIHFHLQSLGIDPSLVPAKLISSKDHLDSLTPDDIDSMSELLVGIRIKLKNYLNKLREQERIKSAKNCYLQSASLVKASANHNRNITIIDSQKQLSEQIALQRQRQSKISDENKRKQQKSTLQQSLTNKISLKRPNPRSRDSKQQQQQSQKKSQDIEQIIKLRNQSKIYVQLQREEQQQVGIFKQQVTELELSELFNTLTLLPVNCQHTCKQDYLSKTDSNKNGKSKFNSDTNKYCWVCLKMNPFINYCESVYYCSQKCRNIHQIDIQAQLNSQEQVNIINEAESQISKPINFTFEEQIDLSLH